MPVYPFPTVQTAAGGCRCLHPADDDGEVRPVDVQRLPIGARLVVRNGRAVLVVEGGR